jgi:hypothetical protein
MKMQTMLAVVVVAGMACAAAVAPAAAGNNPPTRLIERSEPLPGNMVRREDVLLKRSLDNLETYLRAPAWMKKISVIRGDGNGTALKQAMKARGLEWRDAEDVLPQWKLAYVVNSKAREAITNIRTRVMVAENIEKIVSDTSGARNGVLSAKSMKKLRAWIRLGRKFESNFPAHYRQH